MTDTPGWSAPDARPPAEQAAPAATAPVATAPEPPTSRALPLRPLTVGEVLDGSVDLLRTHAKIVFTASVVIAVVAQLLALLATLPLLDGLNGLAALDPDTVAPGQFETQLISGYFALFGGTLVSEFVQILGIVVMSGFMAVIAGRTVLGQPVTGRAVWDEFRPRFWPLLGLSVLFTLMTGIGILLCYLPGIALWVMFALAAPALVLERSGVRRSFGRSLDLLKNTGWPRVLGVIALSYLVLQIVENVVTIPFAAAGVAFSFLNDAPELISMTTMVISAAGGVVALAVTTPFHAGVTAILYVDRRMRGEGLDIDLRRATGHAAG